MGLLCENCDLAKGYGPAGDECHSCASDALVITRIVFVFLVTVLIITNQIIGVRSRVNKILI